MDNEKVELDMDIENLEFARNMANSDLNVPYLNRISIDLFGVSGIKKEQVKNLMSDPIKNASELQKVYNIIKSTSGTLKEIVLYKTNVLTYDHFIVPLDMSKYNSKDKLEKAEFNAASQLEKYQLKYNLPWIVQRVVEQGVIYLYKVETSTEIYFIEIPASMCTMTSFKDGVWRFGVNVKKLTDKNIVCYPTEMQDIYIKNKSGGLRDELIDNTYYELSENAFAFTLERFSDKGIPYYSHLLYDLLSLDELKGMETESAKLDNYKLIHQTPLTDKDTGKMQHTNDVNTMYHNALKKQVPNGVGVVTSPLPINSITLGNSKESKMNYYNKLEESIYSSSGINSELMNGSKSSNEAIALGAIIDTLLAFKVLNEIKHWLNIDLKRNAKTKNWKVTFVESTKHNRQQMINDAKSTITTWFGKRMYMALQGYTPLDSINIIKYEDMLGLSDVLKPLMTSHTASSSDSGRPSNSETEGSLTQTGEAE